MHLKQPHRLVALLCLGHPVNPGQPSPVQLTMTPQSSLSFVERRHAFTSATASGYFLQSRVPRMVCQSSSFADRICPIPDGDQQAGVPHHIGRCHRNQEPGEGVTAARIKFAHRDPLALAALLRRHDPAVIGEQHTGRFECLLDYEYGGGVRFVLFVLEPHHRIRGDMRLPGQILDTPAQRRARHLALNR